MSDVSRARDALHSIPPDLPREEWVRLAMAASDAGLGFDDFATWSAGGEMYDPQTVRDTWKSCDKEGGIKAGTLFHTAKQYGWGGADNAAAPVRQSPRTEPAKRKPAPGMTPAEIWERCQAAPALHDYVVLKQGSSAGLRVVPDGDPLRIMGESMAGALVVPCMRPDGTLSTLQFIPLPETAKRLKDNGKPGKLNLPGARLEGWFTVGELLPGGLVYLVEGIGQAWAANRATSCPAVVCFGWGRVRSVAAQLRESDPAARLVLVPDRGKEQDAEKIAKECRAAVAYLPQEEPDNFDANDFASREGVEALAELLKAVEPPGPRYKLLGADDLRAMAPLAWRVKGVLPAVGVAALYGPSASGKSFLALDMAAAIAEGSAWFDCRVEAAPVVYAALEGEAGFKLRVAAWEAHYGRPLPEAMRMVLQPFQLATGQEIAATDITDLSAVVPAGAVIFIDTLNRAAPFSDENSSKDMGAILTGAKELQRRTGGLVVLVHHTGKDTTKGLRGHSSLFAAMDAALEVTRDGDRRKWKVAKAKDGQDGTAYPFKLERVELGQDDHGDPVDSCVVAPGDTADAVSKVKLPQGGNQKLVMDALRTLMAKQSPFSPDYPLFVPAGRVAVELDTVLPELAGCLTCASDKRTSRARVAVTGLIGKGMYALRDGWLWRV